MRVESNFRRLLFHALKNRIAPPLDPLDFFGWSTVNNCRSLLCGVRLKAMSRRISLHRKTATHNPAIGKAMNRQSYFNYVEDKLSHLVSRVEVRGKLNILDLHLHSENFYADFFNVLFDWHLQNMNAFKQNVEAVDLIDPKAKIIIQVSATATKQKIDGALAKDLSVYLGYCFKFISIAKDASVLRAKTFANPHNLTFVPTSDIYDVPSILRVYEALQIDKQRHIYEFIKKELGSEITPKMVETNLAHVINIISKEDLNTDDTSGYQINPFEIERKIDHNKLDARRKTIEDYKIHHSRVDKIYSTFDKQGANKSKSVLDSIGRHYVVYKNTLSDDELFSKVVECVIDRVQMSTNYTPIPYDELELCVDILVVDAFIRCSIFENPEGFSYAVA